jgi:hypothetical protein
MVFGQFFMLIKAITIMLFLIITATCNAKKRPLKERFRIVSEYYFSPRVVCLALLRGKAT